MSKVHTPKTTISPDLLGWSIGPGVRHAHPDPKHGFAPISHADLRAHLDTEHEYVPWKTLAANRKLHRSLHASHTQLPVWRQWRRPA